MAIYNNEHWDESFSVVNKANGSAIDLTDKTLAMAIVSDLDQTEPTLYMSTDNGYLNITDAVSGIVKMDVPYLITKEIIRGTYYFDIVEILPANDQKVLARGELEVTHGVTRHDYGI